VQTGPAHRQSPCPRAPCQRHIVVSTTCRTASRRSHQGALELLPAPSFSAIRTPIAISSPLLLPCTSAAHRHCCLLKSSLLTALYATPRLLPTPKKTVRKSHESPPPHQITGEPPSQSNFKFSPTSVNSATTDLSAEFIVTGQHFVPLSHRRGTPWYGGLHQSILLCRR
jgi:hypothetical protein